VARVPGVSRPCRTPYVRAVTLDIPESIGLARRAMALSIADVQAVVSGAIAAAILVRTVEGWPDFPINLRLSQGVARQSAGNYGGMRILTQAGQQNHLGHRRQVKSDRRAANAAPARNGVCPVWVYCSIESVGRDLGIERARCKPRRRRAVHSMLAMTVSYSGQFEFLERCQCHGCGWYRGGRPC